MSTQRHIELLGKRAEDKVTGFKGVISSVSFDLYGCVQAVITPKASEEEVKSGSWFDVTRLKITDEQPVMDLPDFSKGYVAEGKKGPAMKPIK